MTLTKGIISRAEALKISPEYVQWAEGEGGWSDFAPIYKKFQNLRRGNQALTYVEGQFVLVRVTSVNHNDFRAVDGPIVRVGNGEYTWRVDGSKYAYPLGL